MQGEHTVPFTLRQKRDNDPTDSPSGYRKSQSVVAHARCIIGRQGRFPLCYRAECMEIAQCSRIVSRAHTHTCTRAHKRAHPQGY